MVGSTKPIPNFDPLGLATLGSDATLAWFRAAELKHSRVAMLATTGYLVQAAGFHFPGMLSSDISFESLSTMKPLDAWCAVPAEGKQTAYLMLSLCCHHFMLTHTHLYSHSLQAKLRFSLPFSWQKSFPSRRILTTPREVPCQPLSFLPLTFRKA